MESISLENFRELQSAGVQVIDSRPTVLFSEKHIQGTIGISINGSLNIWQMQYLSLIHI